MKPSFVLVIVALLAVVPASALALRPAPGDRLVQAVQVRALRVGDRGDQVAALQRLLKDQGHDPGPIDGIFGPLTQRAVRSAQERYGLDVDGLAGRLTVGALQSGAAGADGPAVGERQEGGLVIYRAVQEAAAKGGEQAGPARRSAPESLQAARIAMDPGVQGPTPTALATAAEANTLPALARLPGPGTGAPVRPTEQNTVARAVEEVALTLNGLPDEAALDRILQALAARSMTATFFVTGQQAEERPDLLGRIHQAGHEVASLGYADLDMRQVSPMTARALIRRTQRAIAAATGVAPAFFRPPQGRFDRELTRLAEGEGLTMVLWSNVAVRPVPEMSPERLVDELAATLFPRAVVMLPLDRPNAVAAVEPLLERFEAEGYRSRTLSALVAREGSVPRQTSPDR